MYASNNEKKDKKFLFFCGLKSCIFLGPYNRGYMAASCFLWLPQYPGCRVPWSFRITRMTGVHDSRSKKLFLYHGCRVSRLTRGRETLFSAAAAYIAAATTAPASRKLGCFDAAIYPRFTDPHIFRRKTYSGRICLTRQIFMTLRHDS